ncbi:hypothetical protein LSH36_208g03000 [Paralvinella palmiformis]|uniref:Uncharacterized protein n=1 Tax=Paralvinella palmiformis TaxID=53620 RepID=A0AAD9JR61_9ANNE|nr:hypothetical protein LSH36_208g03000 [Paralvinella palmiformis]
MLIHEALFLLQASARCVKVYIAKIRTYHMFRKAYHPRWSGTRQSKWADLIPVRLICD